MRMHACMRDLLCWFVIEHDTLVVYLSASALPRHTTWWQRCSYLLRRTLTMMTPAESPTRDRTLRFEVVPPGQFDFHRPNDWPKWIQRFERFCHASGLKEKDEKTQVHTHIYTMEDEVDDILSSFELEENTCWPKRCKTVRKTTDGSRPRPQQGYKQ